MFSAHFKSRLQSKTLQLYGARWDKGNSYFQGLIVQLFFGIAYFVVGIVQLFAIADGVGFGLGVGSFISFFIAIFVTYIPLLGSILGLYGAVNVWDWSIWQALVLFFWYIPVGILFAGFGAIAGR